MAVHMTPAQARAAGIAATGPAPSSGRARTRRVARAPYASRCAACPERFTTEAAEVRHMVAAGHHRFVFDHK